MNYTNFTINALVAAGNNNQQPNNHHQNLINKSSSNKLSTGMNRQKCPSSTHNNLNLIKSPTVRPSTGFLNSAACTQMGQLQPHSATQTRLHLRTPPNNHQQTLLGVNQINPLIRTNQNAQTISWNAPVLDSTSGNNNTGSVFLQNVQKSLPDATYFNHNLQRPQPASQLMVVGSPLIQGDIHFHEQQPAVNMYQAAINIHNSHQQNKQLKTQIENAVHNQGISTNEDSEVDLSLQKSYQYSCAMRDGILDRGDNSQMNQKVLANQSGNDDNMKDCTSNNSNNADDNPDEEDDDDDADDDDDDDNGSRRRVRKTKIPKTVSNLTSIEN